MSSRSGSNSGRGFRYQDAVAAWFAVLSLGGETQWGLTLPEGGDDVELRGEGYVAFVQAKSRRMHLGRFPAREVAKHIRELWDRHDAARAKPSQLLLVLERPVSDEQEGTPGKAYPIEGAGKLGTILCEDSRAALLLHKTRILVQPAPQEQSIEHIVPQLKCSPLVAQICFADILGRIGHLSDENGRRSMTSYEGLSRSDVDLSLRGIFEAVAPEVIDGSVAAGICEPVDFLTPQLDADFYLGVDAEPGHIAAGLVVERPASREAITAALHKTRNVLVVGPSGAGKSSLMWEAAHAIRHTVRWYRIRRLAPADVPVLRRLARLFRATDRAPVGFVFDDVGRHGFDGWNQLAREAGGESGILLLGSAREEDLFLLSERARSTEFRVDLDQDLAKRIWAELRKKEVTRWGGWEEPWRMSQRLLLEYVYILTKGERMAAILGDQVTSRIRDPDRAIELEVLRIGACAGTAGALIDADKLATVLGRAESDVGRALHRLVKEHLVRELPQGRLGGLHQLRSETLLKLSHSVPPPTYARTFAATAMCATPADLEGLVADAVVHGRADLPSIIDGLVPRLEANKDPNELAAVLRGLSTGYIESRIERWLGLSEVEALPRTQVTLAARFGVADIDLSALSIVPDVVRAANALTTIMQEGRGDQRDLLLSHIPPPLLVEIMQKASDLRGMERVLATIIGRQLSDENRDAIARIRPDLLGSSLDAVIAVLGTLAHVDRTLALEWVERVGEGALLARISKEWPWATVPAVRLEEGVCVVASDFWHVAQSQQPSTHDDVVALCKALLALCPRADVAASRAIAANGDLAGLTGFPIAATRIPRQNLPADALPEWNRRWITAIAKRIASSSYSDYLEKGIQLLEDLVPAVSGVFDQHLRGGRLSEAKAAILEALHSRAEQLTPPYVSVRDVTGSGSDDANETVTHFQNVLHQASVTIVNKHAKLPAFAGAYAAWLLDLVEQVDKAIVDEPWSLIGREVPQNLLRLRDILVWMRLVAGEASARNEAPTITWRATAKAARPGNALRLAARAARTAADRRLEALRVELESRVRAAGFVAAVFVREDPSGGSPWPPAEVLALLSSPSLAEALTVNSAATRAVQAIGDSRLKLTILPKVGDVALGRLALSGYDTLRPSPGTAAGWLDALSVKQLVGAAADAFDRAILFASELASLDRLELGLPGRPAEEITARAEVDQQLTLCRGRFAAEAAPLGKELWSEGEALIDAVRDGSIDFAVAVQAGLRGEPAEDAISIGLMVTLLIQAELDSLAAA